MIRALLYLRLVSLRNLLGTHAARLRKPKYLAGFLFAAAYFYFFFIRPSDAALPASGFAFGRSADLAPLLSGLGALALATIVFGMWFLATDQPGIRFSEAEIGFLFPAPISRRTLVHYKLLSALFSSLMQTLFFSLIFSGDRLFSARALQVLGGWWVLLSFLNLHYLGVTLTAARWAELGFSPWRRRSVLFALLAVVLAILTLWIGRTQPDVLLVASVAEWMRSVLEHGPLGWMLWPFRWIIAPFFAADLGAILLAFVPPLLLLWLHYRWVVWLNVSFEEAAIAAASRRAARLAEAVRTGKPTLGRRRIARRPPFPIAFARWPELAFLWKNLLSSHAWLTARVWAGAACLLIISSLVLQHVMDTSYWMAGGALASFGVMVGGAALIYGPLLSRIDLRQDLANADVLKTYPLPGWRVVLGELLAPTVVITGILWLALLAWYLGLHGHQPPRLSTEWFNPHMRVVLVGCLALAAPFIVALELLIPNAAPLLFPGWFHSVRAPAAGIDLMGQRLIFGFGQVLVVLLAMLPALGFAAAIIFATQWFAGPAIALSLGTAAVIVVLLGELWCGVWWVGGRFEKLDIVEVRP